jgi:hypothetical protein
MMETLTKVILLRKAKKIIRDCGPLNRECIVAQVSDDPDSKTLFSIINERLKSYGYKPIPKAERAA